MKHGVGDEEGRLRFGDQPVFESGIIAGQYPCGYNA
jgi:hypothetical protein